MAITLYDHRGRPIQRNTLQEEIARPTLAGIRHAWTYNSVASGLTPQRLAGMLMDAANNAPDLYLQLAEEMEERDPHYAAVLGTRKRAVSGLEAGVEAYADDQRSQDIAEAVRDLVRKPAFDDLVDDLLDALGKGFSVAEILWRTKGRQWLPDYAHRDPRFFRFDRETGRELRLVSTGNVDGDELPPYKFITHFPRLKSGLPVRGGIARLVAFSYMCKAWAVKDWLAFADVFGMPLRIGKYGSNATEEERATLKTAVANIASDAAAIIPESMAIEFQTVAATAGGPDMFLKLAEWLDKQISKAVLGQTMTTDDGASLSQAKVHNDVRLDIVEGDAKQLAATLNRALVKPFIDLNFGPQEDYPRIYFVTPNPEDLAQLSDNLAKLVPLGLRVGQGVIRDKLGLPDPDEGDELLAAPAMAATQGEAGQEGSGEKFDAALINAYSMGVERFARMGLKIPQDHIHQIFNLPRAGSAPALAPKDGSGGVANNRTELNQTQADSDPDYPQVAATTLGRDAERHVRDWLDVLRAILDSAETLEEARAQIEAAYRDLDPGPMVATLGEALAAADLAGRYDVQAGAE